METRNPSEFAAFVRDSAKRALDTVSDRAKEFDKPIRSIVRGWAKLEESDKDSLLDELLASWMHSDEGPKPKRSAKRHDPKEAEKTLPKLKKKKKTSAKKK
jgi:hypothetical protein